MIRKRMTTMCICIFACSILTAGWFLALNRADRADEIKTGKLKHVLKNIALKAKPANFFRGFTKEAFASCLSRNVTDAKLLFSTLIRAYGFPDSLMEPVFFDTNGKLLGDARADGIVLEDLLERVRLPWQARNTLNPASMSIFIGALNGATSFDDLDNSPGKILQFAAGKVKTWAAWQYIPQETGDAVAGMILFIHGKYMTASDPIKWILERTHFQEFHLGFLNRITPTDSILPQRLTFQEASETVNRFISGEVSDGKEKKEAIIVSMREGLCLIGIIEPSPVVLPLWAIALAFFSSAFLFKWRLTIQEFSVSLRMLLLILMAGAIAIPFLVTVIFWIGFEKNREETIKREVLAELEENLVQTDASFPSIYRVRKSQYNEWFEHMRDEPDRIENWIQRFREFELKAYYDSFLMVASSGAIVSGLSDTAILVKRIGLMEMNKRLPFIERLRAQGVRIRLTEIPFILNFRLTETNLEEYVHFRAEQQSISVEKMGKHIAMEFIREYNRRRNLPNIDRGSELSSMMMGSIMGKEFEQVISQASSKFGEFIPLGLGDKASMSYIDIVSDTTGRGSYCGIVFHNFCTLEYHFWKNIFKNDHQWPHDVRYLSIASSRAGLAGSFPRMELWNSFSDLQKQLVPPRRLVSQSKKGHRDEYFIAALACRNPLHYIAIAAKPKKTIETRIKSLRMKMFAAAVAMLIMSMTLLWRLKDGVVNPTEALISGIGAMKAKNHDFRITISSGDEWEQLAEAFNSTLEGMKELEVAHLIQNQILPQSPVAVRNVRFTGKSIMADRVGGDYYDGIALDDGMIFLLGDVSGHSVSAALVVAMAKTGFGSFARNGVIDPGKLLGKMNGLLLDHLRRVKMMTCFAGYISSQGELSCANAGQAFPFIWEPGGRVKTLKHIGYPLGATKKRLYPSAKMQLNDPSYIILFSDGIIEAVNPEGEQYGYDRFQKRLENMREFKSVEDFFNNVQQDLRKFTKDVPWGDDVSIALLEYNSSLAKF